MKQIIKIIDFARKYFYFANNSRKKKILCETYIQAGGFHHLRNFRTGQIRIASLSELEDIMKTVSRMA